MGCENTSIGQIPLDTDEEHGGTGLYGNGSNVAPHIEWGQEVGEAIRPLLPDGTPAERGGKIVVGSVGGMSHYRQWTAAFLSLYRQLEEPNRQLSFQNLNQPNYAAQDVAIHSSNAYWSLVMAQLQKRNISPLQVQILWMGNTVRHQTKPYPADANEIELYMGMIIDRALSLFPNTKQVFVSPLNFFGYALPGAPQHEPHVYNEGFGYRNLVNKRISHSGLYVAFGPYFWADGLNPRPSDGLVWRCEDYVAKDRAHPSDLGKAKAAKLMLDFFKNNRATSPWFLGQ